MRRPPVGFVVLSALALLFAACATKQTPSKSAASQGAQTRTVQVDWRPKEIVGSALAYFPNQVEVRPGDTVDFKQNYTGEPHSVTFGTLVDAVIPAAQKLGPNAQPPADLEAKLDALPVMLPEGPGDANQAAVNPCYLTTGAPPTDATKACPKVDQPEFNGKQTYYSSGYLVPNSKDFNVKLASDIVPGTYYFYCNLHGPEMSGSVVVKDKGADIPTQAAVDKDAQTQADKYFADVIAATKDVKAGKAAAFPGNLAGYGTENSNAGVNEFLPATIDAKVGQKVTWTILGPHTITFNPPADIATQGAFISAAPDGSLHLNAKYFAPVGGPGQPAPSPAASPSASPSAGASPAASASAPAGPPVPKEVNGGKLDGSTFHNSGFFLSFPEPGSFFSYSLTFTKPGSFSYLCLVHPGMAGTVKVT
jgi:plastocyanin